MDMKSLRPIRNPSLSSTSARAILDHRPGFEHVFQAIEQLSDIVDGLEAVRQSADPLHTPEARAVRYRDTYQNASKRAEDLIAKAVDRLVDREMSARSAALDKAKLKRVVPEAAEIRSALRAMSQEQRDAAIGQAIAQKDYAVLASIQYVSPLLIGPTTLPIETMTMLFVEQEVPELAEELDSIENALQALNLSAGAFRSEAEKRRDLAAEERADKGLEEAKLAEAALGLALMERPG